MTIHVMGREGLGDRGRPKETKVFVGLRGERLYFVGRASLK